MSDTLLTLSAAARLIPSKPTKMTVYRWATQGVRGIVLQAVFIGAQWYTRADWIQAFLDACAKPRPRAPRPARNGSRGPRSIRMVNHSEVHQRLVEAGLI